MSPASKKENIQKECGLPDCSDYGSYGFLYFTTNWATLATMLMRLLIVHCCRAHAGKQHRQGHSSRQVWLVWPLNNIAIFLVYVAARGILYIKILWNLLKRRSATFRRLSLAADRPCLQNAQTFREWRDEWRLQIASSDQPTVLKPRRVFIYCHAWQRKSSRSFNGTSQCLKLFIDYPNSRKLIRF